MAIFGDNSIWAANAAWKSEIKTILPEFFGEQRRAGEGNHRWPSRSYHDDLDESPFSHWAQVVVPVRRTRTLGILLARRP